MAVRIRSALLLNAFSLAVGADAHSLCGPCLSEANWSALPCPASTPSYEARLGVNGFDYFPCKESHSAAGPNTGNIKIRLALYGIVTIK